MTYTKTLIGKIVEWIGKHALATVLLILVWFSFGALVFFMIIKEKP